VGETAEVMLSRVLRERGQRVTPQRLAIARTVRELDRHTTAETVFGRVSEQMPGVSLPTVYATLDLLEEVGLVRRVPTQAGTAVYDPRTEDHHHLVCRGCGEIVDVDAPVDRGDLLRAARTLGFAADDAQVVVRGLCANCRAASASA
jgi:Fur family ferric uptake transcriptional regulator/Fur family peroxide stress response transcriptional regulator